MGIKIVKKVAFKKKLSRISFLIKPFIITSRKLFLILRQ